jgi:UDP-2,3-diacylglucosamine pyrophosphatase LpxH
MEPPVMTTLIVSDIHLGSPNSQAGPFLRLLRTEFDRLILNGDTINNLNLKKLRPKHWKVLSRLREIALERELILIRGNHDGETRDGYHIEETGKKGHFGPLDVLSSLLSVPMHDEYLLPSGDRNYLVTHGDRFDPTLSWPLLTDTADWCYQAVQKVNKKAAKWLKRKVKHLGGVVEIVKRGSVKRARELDCHGVITGHTHYCDDEQFEGIHFLNAGCWVDRICTYVRADEDHVRLCTWDDDVADEAPLEEIRPGPGVLSGFGTGVGAGVSA